MAEVEAKRQCTNDLGENLDQEIGAESGSPEFWTITIVAFII